MKAGRSSSTLYLAKSCVRVLKIFIFDELLEVVIGCGPVGLDPFQGCVRKTFAHLS